MSKQSKGKVIKRKVTVLTPPIAPGQRQTNRDCQDHRCLPRHVPHAAQSVQHPHFTRADNDKAGFCANF